MESFCANVAICGREELRSEPSTENFCLYRHVHPTSKGQWAKDVSGTQATCYSYRNGFTWAARARGRHFTWRCPKISGAISLVTDFTTPGLHCTVHEIDMPAGVVSANAGYTVLCLSPN